MELLKKIAKKISTPEADLYKFILTCPYRYKIFKIEKRNGSGHRTIAQPSKELKFLQKIVLNDFLEKLPVHDCAMAYKVGVSIKDNARVHINNKYFLKMDFEDFFPSITPNDLIQHVKKHQGISLSKEDESFLSRLFFYRPIRKSPLVLSIGAPSSPFISNTILYNFDCKVNELCTSEDVKYTRYADDLTFSTNQKNILFAYPEKISAILKQLDYPKLSTNNKKTVFSSPKTNRHITGLVITNDKKISIGRNKKRYVKSLIHKFSQGNCPEEKLGYVQGYLNFCNDVEPEFVESLKKKYGSLMINRIMLPN